MARFKRRVLRSSRPTRALDLEAIHTLAINPSTFQVSHTRDAIYRMTGRPGVLILDA